MDSLSELPNLKVMSHSAVFRYKGKDAGARAHHTPVLRGGRILTQWNVKTPLSQRPAVQVCRVLWFERGHWVEIDGRLCFRRNRFSASGIGEPLNNGQPKSRHQRHSLTVSY